MESQKQKRPLIDLKGEQTGFPITKKQIFSVVASIAIYLILAYGVDLSAYGPLASKGLGAFIATLFLMVTSGIDVFVTGLAMVFLGFFLQIWTWGDVGTALGKSSFYSMVGMVIVAMGAEFTPIGKRIALWFIKTFGKSAFSMCLAMAAVTALVSAFVANVAVIILMSGICFSVLQAMNEQPGTSRLGRCMMPLVVMGAMLGGGALINGAPTGNNLQIGFIESCTDGAYTITYGQWAFFGVIGLLVCIVPIVFIYYKCNRVKREDFKAPPKEYFDQQFAELGPLGGDEIRWLIIVISMVICLLSGKSTAAMAMLFAGISLLPGIGVVPIKEFPKKAPWTIILAICIVPMMANLLTNTGLIDWLTDILMPLFRVIKNPLGYSIVMALLMSLGSNLTVNAKTAYQSALCTIIIPITVELGFNPTVVLFPTAMCASFFWCMGSQALVMLNKGYNYWDDKDILLPGYTSVIFCSVVISILCNLLCGVIGLSPMI